MELMKTSLAKIVRQKNNYKKDLFALKNKYIAIIYGGLSRQENVKAIHKRLFDETINRKKKNQFVSEQMLNSAMLTTKALKKKIDGLNVETIRSQVKSQYGVKDNTSLTAVLGFFVFDLLKRKNIERQMSSIVNNEINTIEGKNKEKTIKDKLSENFDNSQNADISKIMIFYLASRHNDSATDHKDYQGKMYIDEKWEQVQMPNEVKKAISEYVKVHNVKTIQWVVDKPVWFITRPNCRHYFKELSVKEVLENSKTSLLKKYDMSKPIGNREYLQTIRHSTDKEWYADIRNAQLLLEKYKERLSLHEQMYRENPCELIKSAIEKDKFLIQKWQNYIDSKK